MILLDVNNAGKISNAVLIVVLVVVEVFIDSHVALTLKRGITFALIYIGIRNLIELVATIYFDKRL